MEDKIQMDIEVEMADQVLLLLGIRFHHLITFQALFLNQTNFKKLNFGLMERMKS